MKAITILSFLILSISCNSKEKKETIKTPIPLPIGQYVTDVLEDSKGNLWFGTIEEGLAKYDGKKLQYFKKRDGLPSDRATGIMEDKDGIFWISTDSGLTRYDGQTFTNFTVGDDWGSNMTGNLFIDSKNTFWLGTWSGVYTFDGTDFEYFSIPYPEINTPLNPDTKNWITEITEDTEGNMWFARDGYGACKYDGKTFSHILKKDGLLSNNVTEIEIDKQGNIWFGTRVAERDNPDPNKRVGKGGVNKLSNNSIQSFPEIKGFNQNDIYEIYIDKSQNIWISTKEEGLYKYDGKEFKNYDVPIPAMAMIKGKKGNLWIGGAGGLFKLNPQEEVIRVMTNGPWD